jgi:hypothetical protein
MGKLVQVATNTVTSPVASVTLTGIDSDDVYMFTANNVVCDENQRDGRLRVTKSGTADTTSNYDSAEKNLKSYGTFGDYSQTNFTYWDRVIANFQVTGSGISGNAIIYLYNFNSNSEFSFVTLDDATMYTTGLLGNQGGGVHKVASASDGVNWQFSSGNISSGTFTLYKVV